MSAENDDFIRRICDHSQSHSDADKSPLHRRSLSQLWASIPSEPEPIPAPKTPDDKDTPATKTPPP